MYCNSDQGFSQKCQNCVCSFLCRFYQCDILFKFILILLYIELYDVGEYMMGLLQHNNDFFFFFDNKIFKLYFFSQLFGRIDMCNYSLNNSFQYLFLPVVVSNLLQFITKYDVYQPVRVFSKVGVESQAFSQDWTYTSGATNKKLRFI